MPIQREWTSKLGAILVEGDDKNRCEFIVWAPEAKTVDVHLIGDEDRYVPMARIDRGYFRAVTEGIVPGQPYLYRINGKDEYADPAARALPDGVQGASVVVERDFSWTDADWRGIDINDYIIYELHIGTFSPEGTFLGAIPCLDHLVELGVNVVEIMPINQFSGQRGWGYDGVFIYAPHNTYGTPDDFKRLVDACHERGLAVVLDVVYNHFGPEGSGVNNFAPYTTERYKTPWGQAMNFDGAHGDEVREYFIENALYWIHEFHVDALRLDATHYMYDFAAVTFIEDLIEGVGHYRQSLGRNVYMIAESDRNNARLITARDEGGLGMDAQWNDDFHHALLSAVRGEQSGYFRDFGDFWRLLKAFREGYVYSGEYAPSRQMRHGMSSKLLPGNRFVIFFDNHDQIGNHMPADRLIKLVTFEQYKLLLGATLLAPYVPLLWMGDEYAETAPFEFFVDFTSPELCDAVRKGRKAEFGSSIREGVEVPDPVSEAVFHASKLNLDLKREGKHRVMFEFHKTMIGLRRQFGALRVPDKDRTEVVEFERKPLIYLRRWADDGTSEVFALLNFSHDPCGARLPVPNGQWRKLINSADPYWCEDSDMAQPVEPHVIDVHESLDLTLAPYSFTVYVREQA